MIAAACRPPLPPAAPATTGRRHRRAVPPPRRRVAAGGGRAAAAAAASGPMENFSLWLKPLPGPVADRLAEEVGRQAREFAGPAFEPHVTLLPDIRGPSREEAVEMTRQLADKLAPFRINFLDVAQGASFHRCVYVLVAKEPAVVAAEAAAREHFGESAAPATAPYMPHLSLLYADAAPEARAASAAAAVARLFGEAAGYDTLLTDSGFPAVAVSLWFTPVEDRSLESWVQLAEFPLRGGGGGQ